MVLPLVPGTPEWPVAWCTMHHVRDMDAAMQDMLLHGVSCMSVGTQSVDEARALLAAARQSGMRFHLDLPDITERRDVVVRQGLEPEDAVMIGGVYRGQAIDRHVFTFTPAAHEIVIEPPVYNPSYAYRARRGEGAPEGERIAHYFPEQGAPLRAEAIVPLRPFDGRQHLRILPATIRVADPADRPEADTCVGLEPTTEIRNRKLYRIAFDLSGLADAMLDRVGVAVYWTYGGTDTYWIFGRGNVAARAESTRTAIRAELRETVAVWTEAAGGTFPVDVIPAVRFGDECFYITGHLAAPASNYPLWDYSGSAVAAFRARLPDVEYPRTWGFPEIYGETAYAEWLYGLHEGCAALCAELRTEIAQVAPGLRLFRNTTRMGVFDISNDHDGSGQELLTRAVDIVHLDPYPVTGRGYNHAIVRDMSYCAGLARRYNRLLIPWMQAHTYGSGAGALGHVSPVDVRRMGEEQWAQGVDAVIWLGYGYTFPAQRPESWEEAAKFHARLRAGLPPKPRAELAVVRPYGPRAAWSAWQDGHRNPADWVLQQFLEVWAVEKGRPYDVFETPPRMDAATADAVRGACGGYKHIVSSAAWPGGWNVAETLAVDFVRETDAETWRALFRRELNARGW